MVAGLGACPDPREVERLLRTLLPTAAFSPSTPITVWDLGDGYRVDVGGRVKAYTDPTRKCTERARVAAAFVALAFAPENGNVEKPAHAEPPPPPPPPPAPRQPTPPTPSGTWGHLDARGAVEDGPAPGAVAGGVMLSAAIGWHHVGAEAGCGWLASGSTYLAGQAGAVSLERWPCTLGMTGRLTRDAAPLEVGVDLGAALGALRAAGHGFATDSDATRFEVGAHAACDVTVHFQGSRTDVAPVMGVAVDYIPRPYHMQVAPAGTVADTPTFWLGFTVGLRWTVQ